MGLFDELEKNQKLSANELQQKYLSDFNKGRINYANDLSEGLVQSVLELGVKSGLTQQQTLDKFNANLAKQPSKLSYDNKVIGALGEIVGELTIAAPASTMGWFGSGGKVAQIYKQGLFGGAWEYFTKPMKQGEDRTTAATTAGATTAGATAVLGAVGRPLEKITNFDFKGNIQAVKDASASLGITPNLLGDFTGKEATRAAEAVNKARGGEVVSKLKSNVSELQNASGKVENMFTQGKPYSGETGKNIATAIQTTYKNATTEGNVLYKQLDSVAQKNNITKITPEETAKAVNNVIDQYGDLFKVLERPSLEAKLNSFGGKLAKEEVKQPAGLLVSESGAPLIPEIKGKAEFTFSDIRKAREGLIDALQAAKQQGKLGSQSGLRISEVIDAMDKDIERWGSAIPQNSEVSTAWQKARDYWKGNVIPLRDADLAVSMIRDPNSSELKTDIAKLAGNIISAASTGQEGAKRAADMVAKVIDPETKKDVAAYAFATARKEATDASGNFDPLTFSRFLQERKLNLQPFVDENLDTLLNKYSFLSQAMTRSGGGMGAADEAGMQAGRAAVGSLIGGASGAAITSVPTNRILEVISRSAFDTSAGRAIMLSGKTLDDFRPLITGGVLSQQKPVGTLAQPVTLDQQQVPAEQEWQMPPDLQESSTMQMPSEQTDQWQMPPDLVTPPSANDLTSQDQTQILNILGASPKPSSMSGMNPQLQMR
jgi:hypothetical protein